MPDKVTGIQTAILRWARESQGLSINQVADRLKRDPAEIAAWESEDNDSAPTYVQLETLAYKIYKRPVAVFFFPQPPLEPDPEREFRTLPDFDLEELGADTRYQIRFAHSLQLALKELNDDRNEAVHGVFRDISLSTDRGLREQAEELRRYLDIPLDTQMKWRSGEVALKAWRNAVEEVGVFVFKQAFKDKEISGFCLLDDEFPIIYLNNSTPKTRQIFSLFHELAHLLFHINGISKFDPQYINHLHQPERQIEEFCNAFSAEFLMPARDFDAQLREFRRLDERAVARLANRYSVSREVVFRRLRDKRLVSQALYEEKAKEWAAQAEERRGEGGDYYANQATYLGDHYLRLVLGKHYQGQLTLDQTAEYLGVKPKNVAGLEKFALREGVPA